LKGDNSGFSGDVHVEAGILDAAVSQTLEKVRQIVISSGAELQFSDNYVTGFSGVGPDVMVHGTGILRFLSASGAIETFGIVHDLTLDGGTIASGIGSSGNVNSLLLTGTLTVDGDAEISAKNVGFVGGAPGSPTNVATDVTVLANKTLNFSGTLSDDAYSSVSSFNKKGAGTMILSGDNSAMTGSVTVSNGTLVVNHENALGTGAALTNIVTVNSGAYIFSNQNDFATPSTPAPIVNTIIVDAGATLGVGTTIGTFSSTSLTLSGGSRIEFKMRDSSLGAGIGYDKFNFGAVDLSGVTISSPIIIVLKSLDLSGALGEAFNVTKPGAAYVFNFGTFDYANSNLGLFTGNISDLFSFDTTDFTYTGRGSNDAGLWSINFNTANGAITLTAVPEPSTYGFGLGALALAAAAIRRRKRLQQKKA
jgi:autotransporter-associated beta strand protein